MPSDETVYVVAPRADRAVGADWLAAVASIEGLRVIAGFGWGVQVAAHGAAATELRRLFDGGLAVEEVRSRTPGGIERSHTE